jgi:phospholipase C
MDRLNAARQSWKIYAASKTDGDYQWAVCPTFADCLYTPQAKKMVPTANILTDATSGTLPNFSIVLPAQGPSGSTSQHNGDSMQVGDNWIGQVVSALEGGPEWKSTAVLLTWDDCGCFYDEVSPPAGSNLGIRVPMILISPWAKSGYTDSTPASVASMLSFTEHVLGLPSLNSTDQSAYNYLNAFNFSQTPLAISNNQVAMKVAPESAASKAWIRAHPPNLNDPT